MSAAGSRERSAGRRLRDAWSEGPVALPGVFNPLVARIAERVGFRAVYLSGGALSAGTGVPDGGAERLRRLCRGLEAAPIADKE